MSEDKDFFQKLADEMVSFFEWAGDAIGDPLGRDAIIRDLGGEPSTAPGPAPLPADKLDAIKAYRDASHPSAEAGVEAIADIATVLDALAGQIETWSNSFESGAQELGHALLELMASNYVRLRLPRLFVLLQAVSAIEDATSTFGPGTNNLVNVWDSLSALLGFVWQPGKSLEQLDPGRDASPELVSATIDFLVRAAAIVVGALDREDEIKVVRDVLTGWDAPGIDLDSPDPPRHSDVISGRMSSISFGANSNNPSSLPALIGGVTVTTAMVHAVEGGPALFLAFGGNARIDEKLGETWTFSLNSRMDAAVALLISFDRFEVRGPVGGAFEFSVGYAANPRDPSPEDPAPSQVAFSFPSSTGSRLDVGHLAFTLSLTSEAAEGLATLTDAALLLDPADHDGFVAELLGKTPLRLPFNLVIGYSSRRGLVLEGSLGAQGTPPPLSGSGNVGTPVIAATIPVGRAFGPVTIHEVGIRLARGPADAPPAEQKQSTFEVDASFSTQIGPVYLRVDQVGLELTVDSGKPPGERNLRLVDLHVGAKFPRGIAVNVETGLIAGGGSILHDPDQGIYFGTIDLAVRGGLTMQAICLAATRDPDGRKGFSLVAILTVELANPWPLSMNFYLQSVGGIFALHRTFDETAARTALPTGQLRNVLFPADPVHHTAEILRALQTLFPARRGSHIFGLLAKIGWASPTLVQFELGVLYEWGNQQRLIILGRVSATLPRTDLATLKLNMDAVGILDFDAGTFALDAALYDSKLCGRFVITGAMAMRMSWKGSGSGFALAVGGLHPKFNAPAGFPSVARLQLALTNGDNPKLLCKAYFALTPNTIQFGADASLYAAAYGFSIEGDVGFDVLIQLLPFHFLAEFRASVQLKRGSHNLFKVAVQGALEGPLPLRASGKASFEILWCDFSVKFNATLADGGTPDDVPVLDVLGALFTALSDPRAWQAELPSTTGQPVVVRQPPTTGVLLHPLGSLSVRQTVVPLGLTRDIDRVGTATPAADRRFAITDAAIGVDSLHPTPVHDLFAPAQFFEMTDDDKLAAPSFESMQAGVTFGEGGYTEGPGETSPFDYTDIVIGPDGNPVLQPDRHVQESVLELVSLSAAATAPVRRALDGRFAAPVRPAAPSINPGGWAAMSEQGEPVQWKTWAEARAQVGSAGVLVLVPRSEGGHE